MTVPSASRSRLIPLVGLLVLAVILLAWRLSSGSGGLKVFPMDDFVEYWAAGYLNAKGQNPYSAELLLPLQREIGRDTNEAVMMWNPPWTLPLVMPFGMLPARIAHISWIAIGFALVLFSADRSWLLGEGLKEKRWVAWILSLSFLPTLMVMQAGQIGAYILFGVVAVMHGFSVRKPWMIGVGAFLLALKPHLAYLVWPAFGYWMILDRSRLAWLSAVWFVVSIAIATFVAMIPNPDVIGQYREAMLHRTPVQWRSPTIGSWLRELFGQGIFWLQFVPVCLGAVWFFPWAVRCFYKGFRWPDDFFSLLLVSFVTASYGAWPFDVVILLPGVVILAARLRWNSPGARRILIVGYAVWTLLAVIMNQLNIDAQFMIWMAPSLLMFWYVGIWNKDQPG
ncbi:glycosyltransferase family 87 protein [Zavarzinella formosa]|uniref:glycosyltransferase family 87 protein n=1 Tax=Zavarzinella formosa TaxID=360055 RepID=UPI000319BBA4|nr:glycosyltransferase family 87 protein [Zavarzinella formosa]